MSRKSEREPKPRKEPNMQDSDKAIGKLKVKDLLMPGDTESQLGQAQMEWNDPTLTRKDANIKQDFLRSQALAASGASAVATTCAAAGCCCHNRCRSRM
jgi:hypothetical protein